jgi:hypothetical protein
MATPSLTLRLPAAWRAVIPRVTVSEEHKRFLLIATAMALGVRIAVLLAAYLVSYVINDRSYSILDAFQENFDRWDYAHFENIARHWYPTSPPAEGEADMRLQIVFLPGYPILMWLVEHITFSHLVAGMLISAVAAVFAGLFIQVLIRNDGGDEAEAQRGLLYMSLFPTAYFLALPYTEALFLALVLGSFVAARTGHWGWSGLLGGYACFTRLNGFALIPALAVQAWLSHKREAPRRAYWLLLVPSGFLAYLAINWDLWGDPLHFQAVQEQHWSHEEIWPWQFLKETIETIRNSPPSSLRASIYELRLASVLLVAALLVIGAPKLPLSYQVYGWASLIMLMSVTWQISMPRYILGIFPIFLTLAFLGRVPWVHQTYLAVAPMLMGIFYVVYATRFGF